MGPSYKSTKRPCMSDDDCVKSIGEICWWFYDGCSHGQCMCDPRSHFLDSSGRCRRGQKPSSFLSFSRFGEDGNFVKMLDKVSNCMMKCASRLCQSCKHGAHADRYSISWRSKKNSNCSCDLDFRLVCTFSEVWRREVLPRRLVSATHDVSEGTVLVPRRGRRHAHHVRRQVLSAQTRETAGRVVQLLHQQMLPTHRSVEALESQPPDTLKSPCPLVRTDMQPEVAPPCH